MTFENALVQTALVGTQKPHVFPGGESDAIGAVFETIAKEPLPPALKVLRLAAALAVAARCGHVPHVLPVENSFQRSTQVAAKADPVIEEILSDGPMRLQAELLDHLNGLQLRLPSKFLTTALALGRNEIAIRDRLIPAIGSRGKWLASQNKAWSYAAVEKVTDQVPSMDHWNHGPFLERLAWFEAERRRDPVAARTVLASEFGDLPVPERARLARAIEVNLGHDDEAFLNDCLKDRAKEVRAAAARVLAILPESAYSQRMGARMSALLSHIGCWVVEAPEVTTPDASWKDDQIETKKSSQDRLGERAWLLAQLVARMHPAWWIEKLKMLPESLLRWSANSPWKDSLHQGWIEAVAEHPNADWSVALLAHVDEGRLLHFRDRLLAGIPLDKIESRWKTIPDKLSPLIDMSREILAGCPAGQHLSHAFSMRLADRMVAMLGSKSDNRSFHSFPATEFGPVLHLDALAQIVRVEGETGWSNSVLEVLRTLLERRKALQRFKSASV